jgi:regulator of cell morphogenesis and NO signaling
MTITEATPVGDIAAALPASTRVFQKHAIDFCCGGKRAIGDVCREQGVSFAAIASAIHEATTHDGRQQRDWGREPLHALVDHIVATYHEPLREQLPSLEAWAAKVTQVHGSKSPRCAHIQDAIGELSADLNDHMRKEELVLFPAIRSLESGERRHATWIAGPMTVMEQEHDRAGALLADLRRSTDGYTPPAWACATVRALYCGLEELEQAMHLHVHLENNVLFPRARQLAGRLAEDRAPQH